MSSGTSIAQPAPDKLQVVNHDQYDPASSESLAPSSVAPDPLAQFRAWFLAAQAAGAPEPEAMTLATSTPAGTPSARIVLLKQVDPRGFVFYTNYTSRKSRELAANPRAALAFHWRIPPAPSPAAAAGTTVTRQVRVVGRAERVDPQESAAYFRSRPLGSQIGAWASHQSSAVADGEVEARAEALRERFRDDVPVPDFWGGWRIVPDEVEFWLGKPSRLHDRVRYTRVEGSPAHAPEWKIERLAP